MWSQPKVNVENPNFGSQQAQNGSRVRIWDSQQAQFGSCQFGFSQPNLTTNQIMVHNCVSFIWKTVVDVKTQKNQNILADYSS